MMRAILKPTALVCFQLLNICYATPSHAQSQHDQSQNRQATTRALQMDGLPSFYKTWLEQDVRWIITDQERKAFKMLHNDEERDSFVEAFWARRDPTPDTFQNEFKVEHYERMDYANKNFGFEDTPGWRSDRGRMYVMYGKPDEIQKYLPGDTRSEASGQEDDSASKVVGLPTEVWSYRYLEGVGMDVVLEFVDPCGCGRYQMTLDPASKDVVLLPPWLLGTPESRTQTPPDLYSFRRISGIPKPQFRDLVSYLRGKAKANPIPVEVSVDQSSVTDMTSLVSITVTLQNRDLKFALDQNSPHAKLNLYGRVITLTGSVAEQFDDRIDVDAASDSFMPGGSTVHSINLSLRNSRYKLEIAVSDVYSGRMGRSYVGIALGK